MAFYSFLLDLAAADHDSYLEVVGLSPFDLAGLEALIQEERPLGRQHLEDDGLVHPNLQTIQSLHMRMFRH